MIRVVVDVESDGPCPGLYSMIELGAVVLEESLGRTFHTKIAPISEYWNIQALAVSGYSREETLKFPDDITAILAFDTWLKGLGSPVRMIADNAGFDWQFINYYFQECLGRNPFGFSCDSATSLYKGLSRDMRANFKPLRTTKHDHNPLNDALGNAEALLAFGGQIEGLL